MRPLLTWVLRRLNALRRSAEEAALRRGLARAEGTITSLRNENAGLQSEAVQAKREVEIATLAQERILAAYRAQIAVENRAAAAGEKVR